MFKFLAGVVVGFALSRPILNARRSSYMYHDRLVSSAQFISERLNDYAAKEDKR